MANFNDFEKLDIRVGTIISASSFDEAKKSAFKLLIDFGEMGKKTSSAQITNFYKPSELVGKKIIAIVNFPPKQIANFKSEVLVLGSYSDGGVSLIFPDKFSKNGDKIGWTNFFKT